MPPIKSLYIGCLLLSILIIFIVLLVYKAQHGQPICLSCL